MSAISAGAGGQELNKCTHSRRQRRRKQTCHHGVLCFPNMRNYRNTKRKSPDAGTTAQALETAPGPACEAHATILSRLNANTPPSTSLNPLPAPAFFFVVRHFLHQNNTDNTFRIVPYHYHTTRTLTSAGAGVIPAIRGAGVMPPGSRVPPGAAAAEGSAVTAPPAA